MRRKLTLRAVGAIALVAASSPFVATAQAAQQRADYVFHHGRVWTGEDGGGYAEAVAVRDNLIVAVGTDVEVLELAGEDTRLIDLDGQFLSPGFIDNHTHFNSAGALILGINLLEVSNEGALRDAVGDAADRMPPGAWMQGGMWGAYQQWGRSSTGQGGGPDGSAGRLNPDRTLIDPVSGDNPAILWNWDSSLFLVNGLAIEAADIDCSWDGVECKSGAPTGRLSPEAARRVRQAIPPKTMEQKLAEARAALQRLAEHGVTTFFDITPPGQVGVYHEMRRRGELTARVNMRLVLDTWDEMRDAGIVEGFGDQWIRYQGLKGFVDGIMGNSSARFYDPYLTTGVRGSWRDVTNTGYVTNSGSGFNPDGNMRRLVFGADSAGFNPRVHAIGDESIDRILDIFEEVQEVNGPRPGRRFAIIHNQVIRGPETAQREAALGIIAEMQPYHTIDDMRWMEERIGERGRWAYAFKTLADAGVLLSFGSDWPGTNAAWYTSNPLQGMYAAVTRETMQGTPVGGWFPEEKIDAETALRAYTVNNAWVAGEEDYKGRIREGFLADLVVLEADPLTVPGRRLKDVRVMITMVDGKIVFERPTT
jgi:predicted amidohydrolase YtcJ